MVKAGRLCVPSRIFPTCAGCPARARRTPHRDPHRAERPAGGDQQRRQSCGRGRQPDYQGDLPDNADGFSDADSQLGYEEENIIDLRDATLADFERVFGSDSDAESKRRRAAATI